MLDAERVLKPRHLAGGPKRSPGLVDIQQPGSEHLQPAIDCSRDVHIETLEREAGQCPGRAGGGGRPAEGRPA